MQNIDILSASKLFKVNIIVCQNHPQGGWTWQIYNPDTTFNEISGSDRISASGNIMNFCQAIVYRKRCSMNKNETNLSRNFREIIILNFYT